MSKFENYKPDSQKRRGPEIDNLIIRMAGPDDIPELVRISLTRDHPDSERLAVKFETEIKNSRADKRILFVAELDDRLTGYARASYFTPDKDAPANICPEGWYLTGIIIDPACRRSGIASKLTRARLDHIAGAATEAFYFANARNLVSIALHDRFGFREISRNFVYPGVEFEGGEGILFRVDLPGLKAV